jgi:tetratricopeptide (TPR) repeat protein
MKIRAALIVILWLGISSAIDTPAQERSFTTSISPLTPSVQDSPELAKAIEPLSEPAYLKDWETGIKNLDNFISAHPDNARAYAIRAAVYLTLVRPDKAAADQKKAQQIGFTQQITYFTPKAAIVRACCNGPLYQALATVRIRQLNSQIKQQPTNADLYYQRASNYLRTEDWQAALADASQATKLAPKDPKNYVCHAEAERFFFNHQSAIDDYSKALDLDPKDERIWKFRSREYSLLGKTDLSKEDMDHARDLDFRMPSYEFYEYELQIPPPPPTNAYIQTLDDLTKRITTKPADAHLYLLRTEVYNATGAYDLALKDINKSIQYFSHAPKTQLATTLNMRSYTYIGLNKPELAIKDCDEALRLDPALFCIYSSRARAHINQGETLAAIDDLNNLLKNYGPIDAIAYKDLATCYTNLGETKLANHYWTMATEYCTRTRHPIARHGGTHLHGKPAGDCTPTRHAAKQWIG